MTSLVGTMHTDMLTYGSSGEAANFDPILNVVESAVVADSIAMSSAGTGSNAATKDLEQRYGADTARFGAEVNAILESTSGIPTDKNTAVSNDLFCVLGGAGSQIAPTDPHAEDKIYMAMGDIDQSNPFGCSTGLTLPGCGTSGTNGGVPYGSSGGGAFQVAPSDLGLGNYDIFANPDPTTPPACPAPAPSACPPPAPAPSACPSGSP